MWWLHVNELEEKERIKFVKKERIKLANSPISAILCKQEMYDFTDKEIIDMIKNKDIYILTQNILLVY